MYTYQEIASYIEEENVKFIRLAFCDVTGREKNVTIMPDELERAFAEGISVDASAIEGFGGQIRSDVFLVPDPSTLALVPWHPIHGKMIRMYGDLRRPDGSPFPADGRALLRQAVAAAAEKGIECRFGTEFEFYVFKTDLNGERTSTPFDNASYMDIDPGDKCESLRREICFTLTDMGIRPESAHHEEGPGQNEIVFRAAEPMQAADNAITFKSVVRTIAVRNGLYASFYPKPLPDHSGNGLHINLSVRAADGADCFAPFLAGVMAHIPEMTVFLNPTDESYRRLGRLKAPRYISWAEENRSQLIRIPACPGGRRRMELRSPDPGANPYVAFALLIWAGLDGVERGLEPLPPVQENLYTAGADVIGGLKKLPESLTAARAVAARSEWLQTVLPAEFLCF